MIHALQYGCNVDPLDEVRVSVRVKTQTASKYIAYRTALKPKLSMHPAYSTTEFIPDNKRQALTRLRLMSHDLRIETGRRNATPDELQLCSCEENVVQNESHVLLCSSDQWLQRYSMLEYRNFAKLIKMENDVTNLCCLICDVFKIYL